jgi:hypothetical protein
MKVFFDENFAPHIAYGFNEFQKGRPDKRIEVVCVVDEFGRGTTDEDWIPRVAQMHGAIITQDFNIHRTRNLADLCRNHNAGIFFFRPPKKKRYKYWDLIKWIFKVWEPLKTCAKSTALPFQYEITPRTSEPRALS